MLLGYVPPPGNDLSTRDGYGGDEQLKFIKQTKDGHGDVLVDAKNKAIITNFINKLADQYSVFAGSNLVNFSLNNTALTVPATVSGAAGNAALVYGQSFVQFKNMVIVDDSTVLTKKLGQLKAVLTSIHANSRFDENRKELYEKQNSIIADLNNANLTTAQQAND